MRKRRDRQTNCGLLERERTREEEGKERDRGREIQVFL